MTIKVMAIALLSLELAMGNYLLGANIADHADRSKYKGLSYPQNSTVAAAARPNPDNTASESYVPMAIEMYLLVATEISTMIEVLGGSKSAVSFIKGLSKDKSFRSALKNLLGAPIAGQMGFINTPRDNRRSILRILLNNDPQIILKPIVKAISKARPYVKDKDVIAALATALNQFSKSSANPVKDKVEAGIIRDYFTICATNIANTVFRDIPDGVTVYPTGGIDAVYRYLARLARRSVGDLFGKESDVSVEALKRYNAVRNRKDELKYLLDEFIRRQGGYGRLEGAAANIRRLSIFMFDRLTRRILNGSIYE